MMLNISPMWRRARLLCLAPMMGALLALGASAARGQEVTAVDPSASSTSKAPPMPEPAAAFPAPIAMPALPKPPAAPAQDSAPEARPAAASAAQTPASGAASAPASVSPGPVDWLNPTRRIDADEASARIDLWERVRGGFTMPPLDTELVRKWEQYYAGKPDYLRRMTERGGRYLFHIVEEVERRRMPMELALLPFVESAFNPQAMSSARASGMWQFIPSTGRDFDLKQNIFRDDRRDVLASTRAALDYLQRLHGMFGDWQHALAAYNWGQGSVQRAIARNQKAGLATDYGSLAMPDETRNYVPKLMAIRNLVAQPQAFAIELPTLENHPYFLSVPIERDIDIALASRLAGLPLEEFRQLNPQMNKPVIMAAGTPQVLLPYDNANAFVRNLARHKGQLATWTAWVAPRTMKTAAAAQQVGMSEPEFRDINRIPPRMLVKVGSTLLVPRTERRAQDVTEHVADNAMLALAPDVPPMRRVTLRAPRKGTSVAAVARQYKLSVAQVAQLNRVSAGASFRPGQTIVVMVPQRAAKAVVARAGGKGRAMPVVHTASRGSKALAKPIRVAAKVAPKASRPAAKHAGRVRVAMR